MTKKRENVWRQQRLKVKKTKNSPGGGREEYCCGVCEAGIPNNPKKLSPGICILERSGKN